MDVRQTGHDHHISLEPLAQLGELKIHGYDETLKEKQIKY